MALHDLDGTLHFGEKLRSADRAVILLHGRGSSPRDIAGMTRLLPTKKISFLAPEAQDGTWYPQRFLSPLAENEPQLTAAMVLIEALVAEAKEAGLTREQVGFIGFSQGACLALEYVARRPDRYAFVAGLSGALIGPLDTGRPPIDLRQTPILLGCAEGDGHIPLDHVEASAHYLEAMNAAVTKQIYPGSAHTVFPQELDWLKTQMTVA